MVISFGIALSLVAPALASPTTLVVGDYLLYRVMHHSKKPGDGPRICEQKMTVTAALIRGDLVKLTTTEQCGYNSPAKVIDKQQIPYNRAIEINAEILTQCERYIGGEVRLVASPFGNINVCVVVDSKDENQQVWSTPLVPVTGFIQSLGVHEDGEVRDYYLVEARLSGKTVGPEAKR